MNYVRATRRWRVVWPLSRRNRGGPRTRSRGAFLAIVAILLAATVPVGAQAPVPAPYRSPTIALVQPSGAGTVPRDKPILVFRFTRGEPNDPVDAGTFAVAVNGVDRTSHFQVGPEEAWGPLGVPAGSDSSLALGTHAVVARICSTRGACAETTASVIAVDASVGARPGSDAGKSTRTRVIELVLDAVRRLIVP